jgi:hypothetical protein
MSVQRIAGICFGIVITAAIADGQWQSDTAGDVTPQLRVHTHTESGGRTVVVETLEGANIDGRLAPLEEVVKETTPARDTTHTRQDVFRVWDGRRRLAETTESRQDTQSNGNTSAIHSTWVPDLNGRPRLTSQLLEESRALTPEVRRTDTTLLVADINGTLREIQRSEYTAHQISPEVVRHEGTELARDLNGGWRPIEIRRGEVRKAGTSDRVEEETIQRPDLSGNLAVREVNLTRSSGTKEQEQVVIETYAPQTDVHSLDGRPPLRTRVLRTTTATADGGSYTVEEVEARSRVSPNEPLRVIRRIVTTVSPSGPGEQITQRQVFELDVNGRLRLVRTE